MLLHLRYTKLEELLEKCFALVKMPSIQPVVMCVMKHLPKVSLFSFCMCKTELAELHRTSARPLYFLSLCFFCFFVMQLYCSQVRVGSKSSQVAEETGVIVLPYIMKTLISLFTRPEWLS